MSITDAQLDEWERLAEQATPGPWTFGRELHGNQVGETWFPFDKGHELFPPSQEECGLDFQPGGPVAMVSDGEFANTPFIAAARTAVPALVAEVRRLRAREPKPLRWIERPFDPYSSLRRFIATTPFGDYEVLGPYKIVWCATFAGKAIPIRGHDYRHEDALAACEAHWRETWEAMTE